MSQNGDDREEPTSDADAGWPNAEQSIRRVDDPLLRAALGEGLERSREIFAAIHRTENAGARRDKKLDAVIKRLDVNDARGDLTMALVQAVAAKIGVTADDVERLREAERERRARDKATDTAAAHTRTRLDSLEREVRTVSATQLEPLAAKIEELSDTEQRRLVAEAEAGQVLLRDAAQTALRVRLESSADYAREAREAVRAERAQARQAALEEQAHVRDEKSKLRWWVLGIVAAVISAAAAGAVGTRYGRVIPVEPPSEHHHKE